jgi:hypothetical protein
VINRQTNTIFGAEWIFENSSERNLQGKTITERIKLNIINPEALAVMKLICGRSADIRDVFMILPSEVDIKWIRRETQKYYDFNKSFNKIKEIVSSKTFKDNLQGVFGYIDEATFEKHRKAVLELGSI